MKVITVEKGDIELGYWTFEKNNFTTGTYNVQEIPIQEVINVNKDEVIGKKYYVTFELGSSQSFVATMKEKTYLTIYDSFVKLGNKPSSTKLPLRRKSKKNVMWSALGVLFLIGIFSGSESDSRPNECDFLTSENLSTRAWNKEYKSCSSNYLDIDSNIVGSSGMSNNIAYYYQKRQALIVLNMNAPQNTKRSLDKLISSANTLSINSSGLELPKNIAEAIKDHSKLPLSMANNKHRWKLVKEQWPSGNGYELKFYLYDL
jgi:hypothetical protein